MQRAPATREKAAGAEPAGPAQDVLKRGEAPPEVRRDQADSALSAGKLEEAPSPGAASGAAVSPSAPAQSVPVPSAPPAAQEPAPRESSRKVLAARTPEALYSAALTDLAGQRYPQALNGFRAFIAQYPQDPKVPYARLALGDAQAAQGHPLEAIQEYDTLILEDAEGKGRVHLTVSATGEPGLGMGDREGSGRVLLGVKADDSAGVAFYDRQGKLRAVLGMTAVPVSGVGSGTAEPASALALFDRDGNLLHQVP